MLKKENLLRLADIRNHWCVSLYLPINQTKSNENRIRLKNLSDDAEKKLLQLGMDSFKAKKMLMPLELFLDQNDFLTKTKNGFAAFLTPDSFTWYSVPYQLKELVVVTDRFHLNPLIHGLAETKHFYLLTLSQKHIKFYEASKIGINEIILRGMPRSISFNSEKEEKQLQMHSSGNNSYFYHGQGGMENYKKNQIQEAFRKINKVIANFLKTEETPLLLAGVDYLHSLYRQVNSYPNLSDLDVFGNVDHLSPNELLQKTLPLIEPVFQQDQESALEMFREKLGTGLASENFKEVFKAAQNGRIETLFVTVGKQKWGDFDSSKNELKIHPKAEPGDKDLFCLLSVKTLKMGGKVITVLPEQMSNKSGVAAVMRY